MTDISQLSDDELRTFYQGQGAAQPTPAAPTALGSLSDDELRNSYAQKQPEYRGSILPITVDASGNTRLDMDSGITGSIKRLAEATKLPGQVYTGEKPIMVNGQPNPELITGAAELAAAGSPMAAPLRSGAVVPGAAWARNVPSAQELKDVASKGYDAARASGLEISGDAVGEMARGLQQSLQGDHGIIGKTAPKTFAVLDELASPPAGGFVTIPGLDAARRGLSNITLDGGTEGFAARNAVKRIDDFLGSLNPSHTVDRTSPAQGSAPVPFGAPIIDQGAAGANPEAVAKTLADARGNYAAAQRSNDITGDLDRANTGILDRAEARAHASHSGQNIDNAIRQRVASFLQTPDNVAGFSQPEIDALKNVVQGSLPQNAARRASNILGAGGGLGQLAGGFAGAMAGGHLIGGPEGGALGAMLPTAAGMTAKSIENTLARRSLGSADETIRMNSPLYRSMQEEGLGLAPAMTRNEAVLRSVLPGIVGRPQQPVSPLAKAIAGYI